MSGSAGLVRNMKKRSENLGELTLADWLNFLQNKANHNDTVYWTGLMISIALVPIVISGQHIWRTRLEIHS